MMIVVLVVTPIMLMVMMVPIMLTMVILVGNHGDYPPW